MNSSWRTRSAALALATFGAFSAAAHAADVRIGSISIQHPYARATAPGQPTGGAYVRLVNAGAADRLLSASADVSRSVELHEMKMENDVMRMRQVDGIAIPAGQTVELKPGGLHIMMMGLKAPLAAGASFPLTLRFEKAGEVTVQAVIEPPGAAVPMKH